MPQCEDDMDAPFSHVKIGVKQWVCERTPTNLTLSRGGGEELIRHFVADYFPSSTGPLVSDTSFCLQTLDRRPLNPVFLKYIFNGRRCSYSNGVTLLQLDPRSRLACRKDYILPIAEQLFGSPSPSPCNPQHHAQIQGGVLHP